MTYILAEQRHAGGPPEFNAAFARYRGYLAANAQVFPSGAYELATSDWYFDFANHRSPHDAWLEEAAFTEADSDRGRVVRLTIRLLGAYHDGHIVLEYPEVFGYAFEGDRLAPGHGDWRYDEFRLAENGHLIHEIEWARAGATARWVIEASDVRYAWVPAGGSAKRAV